MTFTSEISYAGYFMLARFTRSHFDALTALHMSGFLRPGIDEGLTRNLFYVEYSGAQAINRGVRGYTAFQDNPEEFGHALDIRAASDTVRFGWKLVNSTTDSTGNTTRSSVLKRDVVRNAVRDLSDPHNDLSSMNNPTSALGNLVYDVTDKQTSVERGFIQRMLDGLFEDGEIKRTAESANNAWEALTWGDVDAGGEYTKDKKYTDYIQETDLTSGDPKDNGAAIDAEVKSAFFPFIDYQNSRLFYCILPTSAYYAYQTVLSAAFGAPTAVHQNEMPGYILPGSIRQSLQNTFTHYSGITYVNLPDSLFQIVDIASTLYYRCFIATPEAVQYGLEAVKLSNSLELNKADVIIPSDQAYAAAIQTMTSAALESPGFKLNQRGEFLRFKSSFMSSDPLIEMIMPESYNPFGLANATTVRLEEFDRTTNTGLSLNYRMYGFGRITTARRDPWLLREFLIPVDFISSAVSLQSPPKTVPGTITNRFLPRTPEEIAKGAPLQAKLAKPVISPANERIVASNLEKQKARRRDKSHVSPAAKSPVKGADIFKE